MHPLSDFTSGNLTPIVKMSAQFKNKHMARLRITLGTVYLHAFVDIYLIPTFKTLCIISVLFCSDKNSFFFALTILIVR